MKEKIKTFTLLLLVIVSINFTKRLWIKLPGQKLPRLNREEETDTSSLLGEMIEPYKFSINFDRDRSIKINDYDLEWPWRYTKELMVEVLNSDQVSREKISREKFNEYIEKESLIFYFSENIKTFILAKAFEIEDPNKLGELIAKIDRIYLVWEDKKPIFIFNNDDDFLLIKTKKQDIKTDKILESMAQAKDLEVDRGFNYKAEPMVAREYVEDDKDYIETKKKRKIVEKLIDKNIDYIREVVENNGSTIYIYEDKLVKLSKNGFVDYFQPLKEKVTERNLYLSLNSAVDFISKNIKNPGDLYLYKIEEIESDVNRGYKIRFRHKINGLTVINRGGKILDSIEIEVFDSQIRTYKQLIRRKTQELGKVEMKISNALSESDIIEKNYKFIKDEYLKSNQANLSGLEEEEVKDRIMSSIETMDLSYLDPLEKESEDELMLVWVLRLNNRHYLFNREDGELVFQEKED